MLAINVNAPPRPYPLFCSDAIRQRLRATGQEAFEALWGCEAAWVEAPNHKRNGWSGVCRLELGGPSDPLAVYLKRQENHAYRSPRNLFRQRPTAWREYQCLKAMQAAVIATPDVLFYGERRIGRSLQAILVTREVPGSISLDDYLCMAGRFPASEVEQVLEKTAALISRLHLCHFRHAALYGKHVLIGGFVGGATGTPPVRRLRPVLIDAEKARRGPLRFTIALRDLSQFHRRTSWRPEQWEAFLAYYMALSRMPALKPILDRRIRHQHREMEAA